MFLNNGYSGESLLGSIIDVLLVVWVSADLVIRLVGALN
jgi:hypothetical protein